MKFIPRHCLTYVMLGLLSKEMYSLSSSWEEFLGNTVVHFMRNNWHIYVKYARPKIKEAMKAGKDMTLKYHANTKVVKALKRDNGKYSIHLLTHSLKGWVRKDLCIYLNEEEYKKLEDSIGEIYQWIEDIGIPTHKKMYSKCMQYPTSLLLIMITCRMETCMYLMNQWCNKIWSKSYTYFEEKNQLSINKSEHFFMCISLWINQSHSCQSLYKTYVVTTHVVPSVSASIM